MNNPTMGSVETRFADIIWANEPVASGQLVKLCKAELNWKKSTTYTVLRRLCERGLFQNTDGFVTSRISRDEYYAMQSEQFVEETFQGSLPGFLAAFLGGKTISEQEAAELKKLIDQHKEG